MMICAGCSAGGAKKLDPVNLPKSLPCGSAVSKPALKTGMDARLAIAKYDATLNRANERIQCKDAAYQSIRKTYERSK